jgi:lipid-A-disaccharide synthase
MKPASFMVIAGEASGDLLAAELVEALRNEFARRPAVYTTDYQPLQGSLEPRFFGAGGPRMAAAGVDLAFDMTRHAVTGLSDVAKSYLKFRRLFFTLYRLALDRQPDAIICVDFSGFNRRFAHAIRQHVRRRQGWFHVWNPLIIQYVSPQVWASREGRAYQMAKDYDLLLTIFPFEQAWYAEKVPRFRVEFVGHPMLDRYAAHSYGRQRQEDPNSRERHEASEPEEEGHPSTAGTAVSPSILLLPGSRESELRRHLPVMSEALTLLQAKIPGLSARMVLPNERLAEQARTSGVPPRLDVQIGGLTDALQRADVALASTGTVTMECAYFGVPTVALYKTSWSTYQIGKRIVKVKYLAMPNLLANEVVFPEFIQDDATAENLAAAASTLLQDEAQRQKVKARLAAVISSLGEPGAPRRAARAILRLLALPSVGPSSQNV